MVIQSCDQVNKFLVLIYDEMQFYDTNSLRTQQKLSTIFESIDAILPKKRADHEERFSKIRRSKESINTKIRNPMEIGVRSGKMKIGEYRYLCMDIYIYIYTNKNK